MSEHDQENKENVVYKTPPKIAFILGILVGVSVASLTAFGLTYSLLRAETGDGTTNTNAKVAGVEANTNTAVVNTAPTVPTKVDIEVKDGEYVRGDANAAVTLIQYSDFECSYCGRVQPTLDQLLEDYDGQINLVYRHFPLSFHTTAQKAAEASECAGEQGKFWEMHDMMFANQTALGVDNLKSYAKDLGLSTSQFDSCLDDGKFAQKVEDDFNEGAAYGVQGTPATFVNGTMVSGAQPYENFQSAVENALNE
ncbi:DsbA family protein [Patescibacteria group bacterium]|nr:DsbA family protein [Patescibacteria group bacterium]